MTTQTVTTCPWWCTAGHDSDFLDGDGTFSRDHHHTVATLEAGGRPFTVGVGQIESLFTEQGPLLKRYPVEVVVEDDAPDIMTVSEARAMAEALTRAADLLEEIERGKHGDDAGEGASL